MKIFEFIQDKGLREILDRILAEDKPIAPIGYRATIELEPELYEGLLSIGFERGTDLQTTILDLLKKEILC